MKSIQAVPASKFLSATLAAVVVLAPDAAAQNAAMQWRAQDGGNGHWYRFDAPHANWASQRLAATAEGGYLACIGSAQENAFVRSLIPTGDVAYLGAIRSSTGWTWVSGEPWDYTNWNVGEPNGSTVGEVVWLERDSGGWNDHTQTYSIQGGVVEWSADCNGDEIIDYGQCRDGSLADYDGNNVPDCCERGEACVVGHYPVQWRIEDGGNGHWFNVRRTATRTNYDFKVGAAQAAGAALASIAGQTENDFVFAVAKASGLPAGRLCIGGRRCNACPWRWVDGSAWQFAPWGPGEPGNPGDVHVEMFVSIGVPGTWADVWDYDGSERAYMIEWSADCDNDGQVDIGQILRGEALDANANGVPDHCEITCADADLYANGEINGADLGILLSEWGVAVPGSRSDIDGDGLVNGVDLAYVLAFWGPCGG